MRRTKLYLIFIISSLSILFFVGCSSIKTSDNSIAIAKTIYSGTLKELVFNKTITQTQSDQVLSEVLRNVNESKGCIDGFNELVEIGVINKQQANIINRKIQTTMENK